MMKKHSRKKTAHPAVDIERLTGILGHLPDAPTSPRRTDTQRHLIEQLREPLLQAVTQQGYSLQKLADLLREEGVTIHPSTLRRYLGPMGVSPAKRRQPPSPGDPPGTQVFSSGVAAPENSIPDPFQRPSVAPEVPPAPPASPVLNLSSRFTPKPEVPYDELIRQGQARQKLRGEPATESALQPPDEAADP